jgi:hypothetical protein
MDLLLNKIKNLSEKEKLHVLNILKKHDVKYTKNTNGYFFNLSTIDEHIMNKIITCINLIEEKRDLISTLDKKREVQLKYYYNLINTKLNETNIKRYENYIKKLNIIDDERIIIKKKHIKIKNYIDPDILIKEACINKNVKYPKDSAFYRISQLIYYSNRKSNNNTKTKKNDNEIQVNFEDNEIINKYEMIDIDEHIDEIDIDDIDEIDIDEIYSDIDEFVDDLSDETDNEIINESNIVNDIVNDQVTLNEMDYYKNLLKKDGFKFDDDKNVIMMKEKYI